MLSSVARALEALDYVVEAGEAGVSDVGRHIGVTPGTAHRLLATLLSSGYVEQNSENRHYRPSSKLLTLANTVRARLRGADIAHEYLVSLMESVQETVNLAVLDEDDVLYIDKVTSSQPFGIEARIGARLPAYCTALGKVLVSSADDETLRAYLKRLETYKDAKVGAPAPQIAKLREELKVIRRRGYSEDRGEYLPDVYCVAAVVLGARDHVLGAISVSTPRSRFLGKRESIVAALRSTANELSELLREFDMSELVG